MQALDLRLLAEHVAKELKAGRRVPAASTDFAAIPDVTIQRNIVAGALESCAVRIKGGLVIAALTAEVGPVDKGEGDSGSLAPAGRIRFALTTSSTAEPLTGATREAQQHRSRLIAAHLTELFDGCVDLSQLTIHGSEEACWQLNVDIRLMEADGDPHDIATVAAAALLHSFVIPAAEIADGTETADVEVRAKRLPVTLTTALVCAGKTLVAPSTFENSTADAHIRASVDVLTSQVVRVEHGGGYPSTRDSTSTAANAAVAFAAKIRVALRGE